MYIPNFKELDKLSDEGYLRKVISPCGNLVLYNYSDKCTFERNWNEHTLNSRGTIYEISTGKVVSYSFPKFFNFSELSESKQASLMSSKNFTTYEKMDGSLGNIYYYNNKWNVATRGSFSSDQAIEAEKILHEKYDVSVLDKSLTYLVEIIYPENKIIVDYGKDRKLVLLSILSKKGEEFNIDYFCSQFERPKSFKFDHIQEVLNHVKTLPYSEEGYVVKLLNGFRVKFKGDEYLNVARMVSRISPLSIWEKMVDGRVDRSFLESLPEEFRNEYESITQNLEGLYSITYSDIILEFQNYKGMTPKELGLSLNHIPHDYSSAFFELLKDDCHIPEKLIMRLIKPKGNTMRELNG